LLTGANGLRLGCDHHGCLQQHAFPGAQVRFAKCAQQQVAKVVLADDACVPCFPRVRKTVQQPRQSCTHHFLCNWKPMMNISGVFADRFLNFDPSKMESVRPKQGVHFGTLLFLNLKSFLFLKTSTGGSFWCPNLRVRGSGFRDLRWGLWHAAPH